MAIVVVYLHEEFTQVSLVDKDGVLKDQVTVQLAPISSPLNDLMFYKPEDVLYGLRSALVTLSKQQANVMKTVSCMSFISTCYTSFFWDRDNGTVLSKALLHSSKGLEKYLPKLSKYTNQDDYKKKIGSFLTTDSAAITYKWLIENESELCSTAVFTSIESWIISQLTQQFNPVTDFSCASRYGVYNIGTGLWDSDICKDLGLSLDQLPLIKESSSYFGETKEFLPLKDGIPIYALVDEKQSLLLSSSTTSFGESYIQADFCSVSFLFNAGSEIDEIDTRLHSVSPLASDLEGLFAIESSISIPPFPRSLCNEDTFQNYLSKTALLEDESPIMMVSCDGDKSIVYGVSESTTDTDLVTAYFKSVVYHINNYVTDFEKTMDFQLKEIRLGGDLAAFDSFLEYLAEITQKPIIKVQRSYELILGSVFLALIQHPMSIRAAMFKVLKKYYRQFLPTIDSVRRDSIFTVWNDMARKFK
jgi:glycerol kinase